MCMLVSHSKDIWFITIDFHIIHIIARSMDIKFHHVIRPSWYTIMVQLTRAWVHHVSHHDVPQDRDVFYSNPKVKNNTANMRLCLAYVLFVPSYHHELLKKHSPLKGRYRKKIGQVCCRVSVEPKRVWANTIEQMGALPLKRNKSQAKCGSRRDHGDEGYQKIDCCRLDASWKQWVVVPS